MNGKGDSAIPSPVRRSKSTRAGARAPAAQALVLGFALLYFSSSGWIGAEGNAPWLAAQLRVPQGDVYRSEEYADAVAHLEFVNRHERQVRVEEVRLTYLNGERVLRTERPGKAFFTRDLPEHPSRVDRERRMEWTGVCLTAPPVGADRVRLELDLSSRKGLRVARSSQSVEVPLRPLPPPRRLRLPFEGHWRVTQGHTCRDNHRLGGHGGEFAWDLVAIDDSPAQSRLEGSESARGPASATSLGRPVLAPAEGRVVSIVDDVPDNEGLDGYPRRSILEDLKRPSWTLGNYVVLDIGDGAYVLLGHLQERSIAVSPGASVRAGSVLARCGNSGNSIMPHLHLQVMNRSGPSDREVSGLPAVFIDYREIILGGNRNRKDALIRNLSEGDPPEGSIISPIRPSTS